MSKRTKLTLAEKRRSAEIYLDFKWKSITTGIELFSKLVTYFFTFLAIVLGFVFTQKLPSQYEKTMVLTIVLVSILYAIITISFGWGTYAGLQQIKRTLMHYDCNTFLKLGISNFINRAILVGIIVANACIAILVIICLTVVSKIYCPAEFTLVCQS